MKTLITKTLLSSWMYTFDCFEGYEEDAFNDFLATLNREKTEPSEAILNGIAFENEVYSECQGIRVKPHDKWEDGIQKIVSIVKSAQFQVRVGADITVGNRDFYLYGICDAVKAGVIYDLKFKNSSFHSADLYGNYMHSPQHPAYLFCLPEAYRFDYLVSDGNSLYTESYDRSTVSNIFGHIGNFLQWLSEKPDLLKIYEEKWATQ